MNFEFVSHETFPEDEYTKEIVYICLDGKYRICYARKIKKDGGMFWAVPNLSVKKFGEKQNMKAFSIDSNFLNEDIQHFLDNRSWEKGQPPKKAEFTKNDDEVPF